MMKIGRSIQHFAVVWRDLAVRALVARVLQLVIPTLLATLAGVTEAKELDPAFTSHVTDSAHVMGAQAAAVDSRLKAFEAATGHQVFVLTVPSTGNRSIEEYAVEVFQKWKIGRAKIDDGVLFVIAVADRKMRIEVGYGLEGTLTDARCSRIIREIVAPQFAQGDYGVGIGAGVAAIIRTLALPYQSDAPGPTPPVDELNLSSYFWAAVAIVTLLIPATLTLYFRFYGLLIIGSTALLFPALVLPGFPGRLLYAAIIAAWFYGRWTVVLAKVQKRLFKRSNNRFVTLLWLFFLYKSPGRMVHKGKRPVRFSYSFSSSGSSDSSSSDGSNCGGGSGGRSGGAGASGGW